MRTVRAGGRRHEREREEPHERESRGEREERKRRDEIREERRRWGMHLYMSSRYLATGQPDYAA
jgi:hypothetical protein